MSYMHQDLYEGWLDDFQWHRHSSGTKFVWFDDDPFRLAAGYTAGKIDHDNLSDLRILFQAFIDLGDFTLTIQRAIGRSANDLHRATHRPDHQVAEHLDMPLIEYRLARHLAAWARPEQCTNEAVERIHNEVYRYLYWRNPLILMFELRKMWDLYTAAHDILNDTVHDLAAELRGTVYDADICRAVWLPIGQPSDLTQWLRRHRDERGGPGDPRRQPTTVPTEGVPVTDTRTRVTPPDLIAL